MRKDNPKLTYEDLYKKVANYINMEDLEKLKKAYEFASIKHYGEKRLTGEDNINHLLNVTDILADINADISTLCASLLHEVLEDDRATYEEVEQTFGDEVAILVNGVTKINRLKLDGDNESVIENHKKILVGLCEDVRILIIKFADRIHNMRTLWVLPEDRQKRKAKENLDILTPIAHRLGMNQFKSELEDLSLRYYKPDVYFSIVEKLNQSKTERNQNVNDMINSVSALLTEHNIKHEIKGRAKSIYSIYKKLDKGKRFSDIYDLLALRVFVDTEQDCYQALGIIHSKYKPVPKRFKDYIAMPKTNMYQSLHTTVFGIEGYSYEIQIRTYKMDQIAEHGIASHWSYKEKGSNVKASMQNTMEQKLQFFREIMELKNTETNAEDFVNKVKEDVLKNTIYVFTPKGGVIELPYGATPIDFAYRVHTDVGNTMVGALVNGSIVSLDYILNNGDIVKINTNKNSQGPSREWMDIAYTSQAKNKIRSFYNSIDKEEYLKRGNELLSKEVKKRKIPLADFFDTENINQLLENLRMQDINEVYINIGNGKFTAVQVVNALYNENRTKEEIILDKVTNTQIEEKTKHINKTDIVVRGADQVKTNIASCCKPIPGDPVVGYITKGNGITVHRSICPNVSELEERIIDVEWNSEISNKYSTNILVRAMENKDLLLSIISKTSNANITIQSINTINSNDDVVLTFSVLVNNTETLKKFINDIENLPLVIEVRRLIK